ncbi:piggyBac transposable element-derived protein 4-like [Leptopilina heterotoma]|uniref:piggyBac transposable element-derived protein 4-like n=1 Tax=Leptopilina heterotoma TaxID=63436 RepID=UPI001CA92C29|nr:piggyBac transposable element-derived protein 4-like [Leptopilina heterotoma]
MPKVDLKKIKTGDLQIRHTPKVCFLAWKDKKAVTMLTTMHEPKLINTGKLNRRTREIVEKPNVVISYNNNMGGVDLMDQSLSVYHIIYKTIKWYHKLYFHLIDIAIFNAYVIYNQLHPEKKIRHLQFRHSIVTEILQLHHHQIPQVKQSVRHVDNPIKSSKTHYPAKGSKRRCTVCYSSHIRKKTTCMCEECDVPLCFAPCFKKYHCRRSD